MSRKTELRIVDPVLTELARGYSNAEFVGSGLFPFVPVPKEAGKIPTFGTEAFKVFSTQRALRAKSNEIPVEARSSLDYATEEHDAVYPVDYREDAESQFDEEKYATFRAQSAILIKHEKACADLALDASQYASSNKVTLSGTDQFTDSSSDPIGTIRDGMAAVRAAIAKYPNTILIGAQTYEAIQDHAAFVDRIKYSMKGIVTPELIAEIFDVQNVIIGKSVWDNGGTITDIWGDSIVLAYVPEQKTNVPRSIYEPSFGYTLRRKNFPEVDKYSAEGGKILNVRSTDNYVVKLVGADAGYLISDTNA